MAKLTRITGVAFDVALRDALQDAANVSGSSVGAIVRRACSHWLASDDAKKFRQAARKAQHDTDLWRAILKEEVEKKP
jgi:hypothetical protein